MMYDNLVFDFRILDYMKPCFNYQSVLNLPQILINLNFIVFIFLLFRNCTYESLTGYLGTSAKMFKNIPYRTLFERILDALIFKFVQNNRMKSVGYGPSKTKSV